MQVKNMRKLLFCLLVIIFPFTIYAQSEIPSDDNTPYILNDNYKEYGEFLLDVSLFNISPPEIPKLDYKILDQSKDFSKIFRLNPDVTYSKGLSNIFTPSFSSFGRIDGFSNTDNLQMGSFKLKNGMRLNTYGDYNSKGYRMPNRSAMPWERNNFRGAFELKSANGSFGIRVEVQQGRTQPF